MHTIRFPTNFSIQKSQNPVAFSTRLQRPTNNAYGPKHLSTQQTCPTHSSRIVDLYTKTFKTTTHSTSPSPVALLVPTKRKSNVSTSVCVCGSGSCRSRRSSSRSSMEQSIVQWWSEQQFVCSDIRFPRRTMGQQAAEPAPVYLSCFSVWVRCHGSGWTRVGCCRLCFMNVSSVYIAYSCMVFSSSSLRVQGFSQSTSWILLHVPESGKSANAAVRSGTYGCLDSSNAAACSSAFRG